MSKNLTFLGNLTFFPKSHVFCEIFTKLRNFCENLTFRKDHNLKRSLFDYLRVVTIDASDFCYFIELSQNDFLFQRFLFEKSMKRGTATA